MSAHIAQLLWMLTYDEAQQLAECIAYDMEHDTQQAAAWIAKRLRTMG